MADYQRRLGAIEAKLGGDGSCQICGLMRALWRDGDPPVTCDGRSCRLTFPEVLESLGNAGTAALRTN
jgi:hypothetical protein